MNIIFLGPPGAGKGTQAQRICDALKIPQISTGDILRRAMKEGTETGLKAKSYIDAGQLVPDDVIIDIVKERLQMDDCRNGYILDGFPRTVPQAEALDTFATIDTVIDLDVADQVLVDRLSGRRVCLKCGATYHISMLNGETKCAKCGDDLVQRNDDKAKTVLNEAITNANRDPQEVGQYKIDLADIELYMGDVWEATLHYSQVEKDLPNDIIGQTAKFNNAKLSFYIGEFEWAKSQLDVLRAATSKLIANDAMYFSLLISDNEAEEEELDEGDEEEEDIPALFRSSTTDNLPLRYYAKADFLIFQNKDDEAIKMLDSVLVADPYGKLADDVYFQKAKIAIKQKDYLGAENLLQEILKSYPTELLGDDAAYLMAQLYDYYLKDSNKAMEYYQKELKDYSDSLFTTDARKRYRELRGDYTN